MKQRKRLLTMFGCLVLALALIAVPLSSAFGAIPLGAVNRTVVVPDGINAGTYLVHDGFRNGNYAANNRLVSANFLWDAKTMESYVFDPSQFPDMTWHEDGFPLRATYRTPVDHLGEMKYLAQTYPEITNLRLVGYTNGIGLNTSDYNPQPQYRVPLYALEICSAPGVWDGRPATLHQAANHGGELDAAELCANLAWYLCTNYGKIDAVTELINTTRIYIMPYTNGDGNMVSFRSASGSRRTNARGVDLNRNWAYRWGSNNGSSSSPGSSNYRGASPNSEPETTAISGIYRMDNVVSSLSGHTSGQIVIFAWAFVRNPEDAHPLLTTLAKQQADLNGHTPQNGNVMYAQSGEINDYLWGSMRALGFTFEYGEGQTISYLGAADGNDYATASYLDAAGNPKIMKANYSTIANNGIGRPATDVTGRLAFLSNEHVALGYQDIPPGGKGNGINNSEFGGPLTRRVTVEMIQNEIDTNPNFDLTGKIFFSHTPASAAIGNAIAQFLKAQGAIGWLVTNTATNGGYSTFTPAYGAGADSGFPVAGILKGYAADIHERALADPTITFTFKADRKDFSSVNYQWGRHKSAYMLNMSFAATYANHVKGTITDGAGVPLPEAALDASLLIEGKIVDLQSNVGNNPTIERPPDEQWKEWHTPHYDVVGGVYDWSMLPSKQSEYPDKGWDITASANGRYSDFANIKFDVDPTRAIANGEDPVIFADPKYQQTVDNVNFALPAAITTDFDFGKSYPSQTDITVPFSTYTLAALGQNSVKGDVSGLTVTLGGEPVTVTSLGGGDYEATFKAEKAGAYDFVIDFDSDLNHSTYSAEFTFDNYTIYLVTEENEVWIDDSLYVDVMLVGDINYTRAEAEIVFDTDLLQYAGYSDLAGWVGEVEKTGNTIEVQSVPNMNLYIGGSCITPVRLVRLKFTAKDNFIGDSVDTDLDIESVVVNPQLGVTGTSAAAGDALTITIYRPIDPLELHYNNIVIDTHNDSMSNVLNNSWMPVNNIGLGLSNAQLDLPKMRAGGLDVAFFGAYTNAYAADHTAGRSDRASSRILSLLNALYWTEERNADIFGIATTPTEIVDLYDAGKLVGVPAIEGGYSLKDYNAIELLRQYKDIGVAYISLCWSTSNDLGEGVNERYIDNTPSTGGLTALGAQVVKEMNRLGMAVDVSHMNDATFWGVADVIEAPIFASHCNCWGVYENARNLKDEQLIAIAESGGVVQQNFYAGYLGPTGSRNLKELIDMIDYAVDLIGADHVGLGSDFDGGGMPADLPNASYYYRVTEELVKRGYKRADIENILGKNTLRVIQAIQDLAEEPGGAGEALKITADFAMGAEFNSWLPKLSAKIAGDVDADSVRVIIDGVEREASFDPVSGVVIGAPSVPLLETYHIVTFEAANKGGKVTRETKIFYVANAPAARAVEFVVDEEESFTVYVDSGTAVAKPADPVKEGYTFSGWFSAAEGGVEWDFATPVTADLTLYARWEKIVLPPGDITVNFPAILDVQVRYYTNVSGWQTVGDFDDTCSFNIPEEHRATSGATTVQALKGGMWYTFSNLIVGAGPLVLDVPIDTITAIGITAACDLGLAQEDWVYRPAAALVNEPNVFLVFDNDKAYEVRLQKPGFHTIAAPGVFAGDTVDFSECFYTVTVPAGITNVRMQSNNWIAQGANAGDTILLLWDIFGTAREASMTFVYGGITHTVDFLLDGTDPFSNFDTGTGGTGVLAIPIAFVEQLTGNQNKLTITVTEIQADGARKEYSESFTIDNNAAGTYTVGPYKVYVDTKGNDQIRECYIVK